MSKTTVFCFGAEPDTLLPTICRRTEQLRGVVRMQIQLIDGGTVSRQLGQQGFGILQVRRIEALGEPPIDW